jgi:hypothetical protein
LKKYPLSSKAMKAILAATIALTPILTTGTGLSVQTVSAAEYNNIESLITYLDTIYSKLTPTEQADLLKTKATLEGLNWQGYATQIVKSSPAPTPAEIGLVKGLMELITSTTVLDLKGKINTFKTTQAANVKAVFGESVTTDTVLLFIADVELKFISNVQSKPNLKESDYFSEFVNALLAVKDNPKPEYQVVITKFFNMIDMVNTLFVFQEISGKIDAKTRAALITAIQKGTPGGGPGTTPPVPGTNPPTGANVITLPVGATEILKENNQIITKVLPAKVSEIINALSASKNVIPIQLDKPAAGEVAIAQAPASLFTEALKKNPKAMIAVTGEGANYKLPASEVKISELANTLGVAAGNVDINIAVNVVSSSTKLNLVSNVIEYTVTAVSGNNKVVVSKFSTYVERDIVGAKNFNPKTTVAVKLNDNGTFSPIPTIFNGNVATVKSLTNSKYTIIENNKTFSDLSENFAKPSIEKLASKYIVNGKTKDKFDPNANMTRAEFAVLLVRALGLPTSTYDKKFKDVNGSEWFAKTGELTAAVQYGLVKGVNSNTFAPNQKISRAEAAVMIHRAMDVKFLNYDKSQLNKSKTLANFKDSKNIGTWAKAGVEAVYQAGIVNGKGTNFDPNGYTTRQEMAKILDNFLVSAKLMN